MPQTEELANFVRDALKSGQSRQDIRTALCAADWTDTEIDLALAGWTDTTDRGPVPRPIRSTAAKDAFFYALLFVAFGMVAGNVLALSFGQINFWLPDVGRTPRYAVSGLRWSMAALIVFTPAFWLLNRFDTRASGDDPSRQHGTIRRWLSSLAMLIAVITLMGDALFLIYTFLDGQMTSRFLAKSAIVALISVIVLAYFRQDQNAPGIAMPLSPTWVLSGLAILVLGLSFWTIGGPAQGKTEQRDRWRLSDLRSLARDVQQCHNIDRTNLPETLDPLSCASNPQRLTAFAADIEYKRVSATKYKLCTDVEFPAAIRNYDVTLNGKTACIQRKTD